MVINYVYNIIHIHFTVFSFVNGVTPYKGN